MVEATEAGNFIKMPGADALYEHLTNVLLNIVKERPEAALQAFESGSVLTKAGASETVVHSEETAARVKGASQAVLDLIKPPKKSNGEEEEEEEEEEKEQAPIPDFMAESSLLEWAGFGLGKEKTYEWHLSIQNLATEKELTGVRFWGIIRGTQQDYHIVEAKLEEYPEEEEAEGEESKNEAMGTGANECIYFVANTCTDAWTQLPAVKASHVILATQMKRFFHRKPGRLRAWLPPLSLRRGMLPARPDRSHLRRRVRGASERVHRRPGGRRGDSQRERGVRGHHTNAMRPQHLGAREDPLADGGPHHRLGGPRS